MKKIIASVIFFGSFGVAFAQIGIGGLPPYSAGINPLMMERYRRPEMCKKTTNKKVFMGCELKDGYSQRHEGSRGRNDTNCLFLNEDQSACAAAYTGESGACAKAIADGKACMGTSNKPNNKCRAACKSRSSRRFCSLSTDCSGKSPKSYCKEVYGNIPTDTWGACPVTASCGSRSCQSYEICCSMTGGPISQDGASHFSKSCMHREKVKQMIADGIVGGVFNENGSCELYAP